MCLCGHLARACACIRAALSPRIARCAFARFFVCLSFAQPAQPHQRAYRTCVPELCFNTRYDKIALHDKIALLDLSLVCWHDLVHCTLLNAEDVIQCEVNVQHLDKHGIAATVMKLPVP